MMDEWFTASELAGLPGLPKTKRNINKLVLKEGWVSRPIKGSGGGKEHHFSNLPAVTQIALIKLDDRHAENTVNEPVAPSEIAYDKDALWQRFDIKTASQKEKAEQRLALIKRVIGSGGKLNDAMKTVGAQSGVKWRTIHGWYHGKNGKPGIKEYDEVDWLAAICPEHIGRTHRVDCDSRAFDFLKTDYLRPEKPTFSACYYRMKRAAARQDWNVPSIKTMERRLSEIPLSVRVLKRDGESALVALYPAQERTVKDIHALQWINGDGYQHNVFVKWPGEDKPARPKTWFWQDIQSRKILAYRVDLSENTDSIRLSFGDLVDTYGIPEHVVIDNTRAAANKWMTGGVKNRYRFKVKEDDPLGLFPTLDIQVHWTSVIGGKGHGQAKPIERSFGVGGIGEYVDKHPKFAGAYTGDSPKAKPDNYGTKAVPVDVFLAVLQEEIVAWNARENRRTEMANGSKSFDQVFNESYQSSPIRKATAEQRRLWMLTAEAIRVKKDGSFTLDAGSATGKSKSRYSAIELIDYADQKIIVRFDPQDLHGMAYAYTYTLDNRFIAHAPCIQATGFGDTEAARSFNKQRQRFVKASKIAAKAETQMSIIDVANRLPAIESPDPIHAKVVRPLRPQPAMGRPVPEPQLSDQDSAYIIDFQKSFEQNQTSNLCKEDGPHERYDRWTALNDKKSQGKVLNKKDEQFWQIYPRGAEYCSMRDFYADFEGISNDWEV